GAHQRDVVHEGERAKLPDRLVRHPFVKVAGEVRRSRSGTSVANGEDLVVGLPGLIEDPYRSVYRPSVQPCRNVRNFLKVLVRSGQFRDLQSRLGLIKAVSSAVILTLARNEGHF